MAINLERFISNACCNSCQSFYDYYVEANVRFRSRLGMKAVIIRRQLGHCCDWCASLAGIYDPSNAPDNIYKRHENCRCLVTSKTEKGYQNVWNKKIYKTQRQARIEKINEIKDRSNKLAEIQKRMYDIDIRKETRYKDVTKQYLSDATPGKGNVDYDDKYEFNKYSLNERRNAELIHRILGGDIFLINHTNYSYMTSDYIWNDAYWELKNPESLKGIDKLVQKGLKQIAKNPGGLIIDIGDYNFSMDKVIEKIEGRLFRKENENMALDVMLVKKNRVVKVIRY
ncbi:MAG: hypothetical protein IJJ01_07595 [Firmicutes bacterium]|nr:hypothetical protein [Bacillota bacterium]